MNDHTIYCNSVDDGAKKKIKGSVQWKIGCSEIGKKNIQAQHCFFVHDSCVTSI